MRNNDENTEIFDELYLELLATYEYLIHRLTNLVANNVQSIALKIVMQQYLTKFNLLEFKEYFEERFEEMIATR